MAGPTKSSARRHRGPAKIIPLPAKNAPRSSGKPKTKQAKAKQRAQQAKRERDADPDESMDDPEEEEDEEDEDEDDEGPAKDVEDMVDNDTQSSEVDASEAQPATSNGKAKAQRDPNLGFLTSMDVNAISTSNAELERIKKQERKDQKGEMKMAQKMAKRGRKSSPPPEETDGESGEDAYETEFEDEDLGPDPDDSYFDSDVELGSDVYEYSEGERSGAGTGPAADRQTGDDEDSSDPAVSSDDEAGPQEPQDEEAREDARIQKRAAQMKRKRKEDEATASKLAKRARLPVRGEAGWQDKLKVAPDDEEEDEEQEPEGRVVRKQTQDLPSSDSEEEDGEAEEAQARKAAASAPHPSITTGSRFGMLAPYAVVRLDSRAKRTAAAREQIARLAQTVMADPEESSVGLVRRMLVFARAAIRPPKANPGAGIPGIEADPARARKLKPISVEPSIRAAAVLSLMAVFGDILPGYRIRQLSEQEQNEQVSNEIRRRREFEQGILEVYRDFLELCEELVKDYQSGLLPIGIQALSTLLLREPQFNYRTNIIRVVVSCLSRATWTPITETCASTLIDLLKTDQAGDISLEVVRLLHRMIKERRYQVHAAVLDILLHLRLKDELGNTRASTTTSDLHNRKKLNASQLRKNEGHALSKKEVKRQRELREIEREMAEADAEVNVEEREKHQTETLKLLFVLYFSILKADNVPSSLLGSALEGLSVYAHRINIDFFRDLLAVLRAHVARARSEAEEALAGEDDLYEGTGEDPLGGRTPFEARLHDALLCLTTAFELLSGQGAALNIDLADMVNHLYGVLMLSTLSTALEEAPVRHGKLLGVQGRGPTHVRSSSELLFRTLDFVLLRPSVHALPLARGAAFAKRLLTAAIQWPAMTSTRALRTINVMLARDARLAALFDGQDRARDGRYDGLSDVTDTAHVLESGMAAWELHLLRRHANADVRAEAVALVSAAKSAGK